MISRIKIENYRRFRKLEVDFKDGLNILVGGNEAGKSTLLEAITLAITGRVRGQWAQEELHPYWFNRSAVQEFFAAYREDPATPSPEVLIELFIESASPDLIRQLQGTNNSERKDTLGLQIQVKLDPDYTEEFVVYMQDQAVPELLPTDYFQVQWSSFRSPEQLRRKPHGFSLAQVDNRTLASSYGVDYYTRQLLVENIEPTERARLATALRIMRSQLGGKHLVQINEKLRVSDHSPHQLGVQLDQSSNASWEAAVTPHIDAVPFVMSGQAQQAFTKIELAMLRNQSDEGVILVEEPENHLSHTRLRQLIERLSELAGDRQLIVTTHNSFVLNRLGIDNLRLLEASTAAPLDALPAEDVEFFQRLPNFDTLRLVLADKVILVEGPSDQLYIEHAFQALTGKSAAEHKVDVIAINGTSFARWFSLAKLLNKPIVGVRDNDEKPLEHWEKKYRQSMGSGAQLFAGDPSDGKTLEPQIVSANLSSLDELRQVLGMDSGERIEEWMTKNKTEAAFALTSPTADLNFPQYIKDAVDAVKEISG